ncbi:hypothetical protein EVAR_34618_1 [Eumeta japonica]|uniref:Odorant receptor n=1 Tax=Eumeta variegata TaxID=151549 RepID=A0A4C1VGW4_EUMVA|nr:hypothetical protein EVAR_34618_1 [Eumeta japonica]
MRSLVPTVKNYHQVADRLFCEFQLIHFKHKNEYHSKVNNLVDRFLYYFTIGMVVMSNVAWIVYNIPPIYHNYQIGAFTNNRIENSTLEFSAYYNIPKFDIENVWIPITLINFYLTYAVASLHCILDLYLSLAVFQIVGHLYILKHNLTSMLRPKNKNFIEVYDMPVAVEMFDDEENEQVYKDISECISHHCMIIRSLRPSYGDDAVSYVQLKHDEKICTVKGKIFPEYKVHVKLYAVTLITDEEEEFVVSVEYHGCVASKGGCKHTVAFLMWTDRRRPPSYDSPEQSTSKVAAEANGSVRQGICERIAVRAGCPFVGCDRTSDNFKTQLAISTSGIVSAPNISRRFDNEHKWKKSNDHLQVGTLVIIRIYKDNVKVYSDGVIRGAADKSAA